MREPLNDDELNALLKRWDAPVEAPTGMERVLLRKIRPPWWTWFWTGSIRVPAPVAIALILIAAAISLIRMNQEPDQQVSNQLAAGLEPVTEFKPRIVRSSYVTH